MPGFDLVDYQDFTGTPMIDGKPSPALIKYFDKAKGEGNMIQLEKNPGTGECRGWR